MAGESDDAKLIDMNEGVKILYKDAIDNLMFLKRQQWMITNYALLAYTAVVTLSRNAIVHEKWGLAIIAAAVLIYGVWCVVHTQLTMTRFRSRLFHIYLTYFTEEERRAYKMWNRKPTVNHTPQVFYGLVAVQILSAIVAIYLIVHGVPWWNPR